jgi:hypothetical protein
MSTTSTRSSREGSPKEKKNEARVRRKIQGMLVERTPSTCPSRGGSLEGGWTPHEKEDSQGDETRTR